MTLLDSAGDLFVASTPALAVGAVVLLTLAAGRWLFLRRGLALDPDRRLPRQLALGGVAVVGLLAVVLALPVPAATRNQLLSVIGLLGSGVIALASTTIVANAMAGVMLRTTRSFRTGDFIRVGEHFGRVTERGLLDTEIQTEDRELTMLPNLYLITNPVTVVRTSGTLVSVTLSLGYDVHHARTEPLLVAAAERAGLEEPFVRVLELGNYAVTYRVSGFLADIKNLLTVRSDLGKTVLDALHEGGVEILSPAFMNQRPVPADRQLIPPAPAAPDAAADRPAAEDLMFDKADRAERIESHRRRLEAEVERLEGELGGAGGDARTRLKAELDRRRKQLAALANGRTSPGK